MEIQNRQSWGHMKIYKLMKLVTFHSPAMSTFLDPLKDLKSEIHLEPIII